MVLSMVMATRERTLIRWNIDLQVCAPSVACSPLHALAGRMPMFRFSAACNRNVSFSNFLGTP